MTVAEAWLAEDPDPETRAELQALLEAGDTAGLADRFGGRLEFGTAGLRGALGAGPNRMNRVVVTRAAAGLAAYPKAHGGTAVVVGYDARHKSDVFARDTAEVMTGAGLRASVLPRPLPTPVLAFAIRHLGAVAGVMVTARHNPPQDNGYKVYLGDGSQIVPPADAEIAAAIEAVGPLAGVPRAATAGRPSATTCSTRTSTGSPSLVDPASPRDLRIVYTALHGVGRDVVLAAFARAGFPAPDRRGRAGRARPGLPDRRVPQPGGAGRDGPRPRRRGRADADLVLANDPDADRCAVAVADPRPTAAGGCCAATRSARCWPRTWCAGTRRSAAPSPPRSCRRRCSAGSPPRTGWRTRETLTGFKWIARVEGLRFGYEEALGYCVDPAGVRDKDGISAALLVAELAATLKAEGRTLLDLLDDLAREHGLHATDQLSVRVDDLSRSSRTRWPGCAPSRRRRSAVGRSSAPRTSRRGPTTCRRPTACATPSPTAAAWSCARAAPSPSSRLPRGRGAGHRRRRRHRTAYGGRGPRRDQAGRRPPPSTSAELLEPVDHLVGSGHGGDLVADPARALVQLGPVEDIADRLGDGRR